MPTPRRTVSSTARINRKKIAVALLAERLGLEDEWKDPGSIVLPSTLPQSEVREMFRAQEIEMDGWLDELVSVGCQKRVLYWCLQQLGPTADRRRTEGTLKSIPNNEDEALTVERPRPRIATKEDIERLVTTTRKAAKLIFRYRSELCMAAEALRDTYPLPQGLLTDESPDAVEAIQVLLKSLEWVKGLAQGWQTPQFTTDVKSTGVLYLLLHVWIHTKKSPKPQRVQERKKPSRRIKLYRLDSHLMVHIALIVDSYQSKKSSGEYLNERLQNFRTKYPGLFDRMVNLLEALDRASIAQ